MVVLCAMTYPEDALIWRSTPFRIVEIFYILQHMTIRSRIISGYREKSKQDRDPISIIEPNYPDESHSEMGLLATSRGPPPLKQEI